MFECQYNEEMQQEVLRLEAKKRAVAAGHPQWDNACTSCGSRLTIIEIALCGNCDQESLKALK